MSLLSLQRGKDEQTENQWLFLDPEKICIRQISTLKSGKTSHIQYKVISNTYLPGAEVTGVINW